MGRESRVHLDGIGQGGVDEQREQSRGNKKTNGDLSSDGGYDA